MIKVGDRVRVISDYDTPNYGFALDFANDTGEVVEIFKDGGFAVALDGYHKLAIHGFYKKPYWTFCESDLIKE